MIEDVKPADCGLADEGWFIEQRPDGWACWSDATPNDVAVFATREEAERYWADAAEACRQ